MSWEDSRYPQPYGQQQQSPYPKTGPTAYVNDGAASDYDIPPADHGYSYSGHAHDGYAAPAGYSAAPAAYAPDRGNMAYEEGEKSSDGPWYSPKTWGIKAWALVVAIIAILLIVIIVPSVVITKKNRYPDYSPLTYELQDEYSGTSFFDKFNYFTGYDPAQGFVHYVPREQAQQLNLTSATNEKAVLKVDTTVGPGSNPDASTGRFSVRIESKQQYDKGLFIFDVFHTPFGCGTWPALWLADANNWPDNGEIDIMEAVNKADEGNQMTLHTTGGCSMGGVKRKMTGESLHGNCHNVSNSNAGCGVQGAEVASYGKTYNDASGGIMAVEWRSEGIRMWQFGRGATPADIADGIPDPSTWGLASADFPNTNCGMDGHFRNQSLIVNIDLCGQFAGGVYPQSGCPGTCTDFVANNPSAFEKAYWEFGAFKVYQATDA